MCKYKQNFVKKIIEKFIGILKYKKKPPFDDKIKPTL